MRRFLLVRNHDHSGVSGIGTVAKGVEFDDGICVMRWCTDKRSTAIYETPEDLIAIHGHDGDTRMEFLD